MFKVVIELPDEYKDDYERGYFADALYSVDCSMMYKDDINLIDILSDSLEKAYLLEE